MGVTRDAVRLANRGLPAVALITEPFARAGRVQAESMGLPTLPIAVIPHPDQRLRWDLERTEQVSGLIDAVTAGLESGARVLARRSSDR